MNPLQNKSFLSRLTDLISDYFARPDTSPGGKLYLQAILSLGKDISPKDEAPDELACVDSLEEVYKAVFGEYIGKNKTLSTRVLYQTLLFSPKFKKIQEPEKGCIIISPTGSSLLAGAIGHVGIVGDCGFVMSNDSFRQGLWLENYSLRSWNLYFGANRKFPVYYFRRVEEVSLGNVKKNSMSLTISGILVSVVGTVLLRAGFSEVCSNEIIANTPLVLGGLMAWVGRVRKGDVSWLGARK